MSRDLDSVRHRLLVLTNIWTPYRDAFFRVLHEQCNQAETDLEVSFAANSEKGRPWIFPPAGVPYRASVLPGIHPRVGGSTFHFNPTVVRSVRHGQPTWIVSGGSWLTPTMLLGRGARKSNSWCIMWSEGHADAKIFPAGPVASLRSGVHRLYDGFAAPNARSAAYLQAEAGKSIPVLSLPNTVDEAKFRSAACSRGLEASRDDSSQPTTLLVVARLMSIKRVRETVEAFLRLPMPLRQRGRLAIAGDGPERSRIEGLASLEPRIELLGQLDEDEMVRAYGKAHGFALLSSRDNNPLSPIEASFASLPLLLSTEVGNSEDLIISGRNGWTVDMTVAGNIDKAFEEFFGATKVKLSQMGQESRGIVERSFSREQVASRFLSELNTQFPAGMRNHHGT